MEWSQALAAAKDIVLATAGGVTAFVALSGLKRWKEELQGKAGFEVARSVALATYRLRDEIHSCRSPLVSGPEFPDWYHQRANRTPEEEAEAWSHVYKNRWEPVKAATSEFDAQVLEGEALWGKAFREKTDLLRSCVQELRVAIEEVLEYKTSGGTYFGFDKNWAQQMRRIVSGTPTSKDNPMSDRVAAAVDSIEKELRKHLGRS